MTEVRPGGSQDDIARAIGVLFNLFGPQRLIWGSDWPVLTLAGDYQNGSNLRARPSRPKIPVPSVM